MSQSTSSSRVSWVDYAKGLCIVMVVMMHSTLGVEAAAGETGWMHYLVAFAYPFRMPDFFLIAGLFLSLRIDHPWRSYLDKKVLHFVYFYVLWMTIQFTVKAPVMVADVGAQVTVLHYFESFIEPFGTLWFIYLLPVFFVATKLAREARVSPLLVWIIAAELQILPIHTGWLVIDEFAGRFVYFYSGYLLARHVFSLADRVEANKGLAVVGLAGWALANGALVYLGYAKLPVIGLALGFAGAAAVVCAAVLLSQSRLFEPLRYFGEHSIVIYLAFFLPMAASRILFMKFGAIEDIGSISLMVTAIGVSAPIFLFWAVRNTPLSFLFVRPRGAGLMVESDSRTT
ncbi:MAG: acyltransferase family protein [Fimbriimonadaceae bacterium]|nr:acyltransferase family protein [Alphaproteobacteria bacterium]